MNELHDMIRVSCEETITPDVEAEIQHKAETQAAQPKGQCEDAPCCGCCGDGGSRDDGYGTYADDSWHDAHEYPDW